MAAADVLQGGNALGAFGAGHGTAGGKAAGVGRVNGGGDLAGQGLDLPLFPQTGHGNRREQRLGVGVLRLLKQLHGGGLFHDLT